MCFDHLGQLYANGRAGHHRRLETLYHLTSIWQLTIGNGGVQNQIWLDGDKAVQRISSTI